VEALAWKPACPPHHFSVLVLVPGMMIFLCEKELVALRYALAEPRMEQICLLRLILLLLLHQSPRRCSDSTSKAWPSRWVLVQVQVQVLMLPITQETRRLLVLHSLLTSLSLLLLSLLLPLALPLPL
jgi:hypothetical protein